jgi:hypothetical protein
LNAYFTHRLSNSEHAGFIGYAQVAMKDRFLLIVG